VAVRKVSYRGGEEERWGIKVNTEEGRGRGVFVRKIDDRVIGRGWEEGDDGNKHS
jgi:hypothetical protein